MVFCSIFILDKIPFEFEAVNGMKIKDKMTLYFILLSTLPLVLVGGFASVGTQEAIRNQVKEFLGSSIDLVSLMLGNNTQSLQQAIQSVTEDSELMQVLSVDLSPSDPSYLEVEKQILQRFMMLRQQFQEIRSVFVIRPNLPLIINGVPNTFESSFFRTSFFESSLHKALNNLGASSQWVTLLNGQHDRLYLGKLWHNSITGKSIGFLIFSVEERSLSRILQKAVGEGEGKIYLLNSRNQMISSYPHSLEWNPEDLEELHSDPALLDSSLQTTQGWRLVFRIPLRSVLGDTQFLGMAILIFSLGMIIISMSLAFMISRYLSQPMTLLMNSMKQAEAGIFLPIREERRDEFSQLYKGYNGMMIQLSRLFEDLNDSLSEIAGQRSEIQAYNSTLEERVELRTQELLQSEKMASLGGLVAGVAHEINTPLGIGITSVSYLHENIEILKKNFESGSLSRSQLEMFMEGTGSAIEIAMANLKKAGELVSSFKRLAVDQSREEKVAFSLALNISDTLKSLKPRLTQCNQKIIFECPEELEMIGYPGIIYQILSNLVLNCLNHAWDLPEMEGEIKIVVQQMGSSIRLTVSDNGKGMDPTTLSKVFEPFFTTKRGNGGTGLGLHIVFNLVTQKLQGKIYSESETGNGTSFYLEFPKESI